MRRYRCDNLIHVRRVCLKLRKYNLKTCASLKRSTGVGGGVAVVGRRFREAHHREVHYREWRRPSQREGATN